MKIHYKLVFEILEDKFNERSSTIRIQDYEMLNTNKFINDIIIEFYLNYALYYEKCFLHYSYWYTQKLSEEDRKRSYVFSIYFYTTLAKSFNASNYPAHYIPTIITYKA
ncbi:sentrin-specific protease 6-like [Aphis craccivora]|uniref:Sentrin-specific protease 6-like n=1 Tax=Aphis craccivora TaxID=307492 RepID=A0A6G0X4V4_APHCR|nr:sentrin-specific protease 6-like [Aphis craccivora]